MAKKPQSQPPIQDNFTALEIASIKGSRETVLRIARNFTPPLGTKRGNLILFSAAEKDQILAEIQDGPGNLKQIKGMRKNGSHKKGNGE